MDRPIDILPNKLISNDEGDVLSNKNPTLSRILISVALHMSRNVVTCVVNDNLCVA
ncbi:hypothetical protein ACEWUY_001374 [Acinetobacter baumannii]|uniref:hypothetical protein n=1 Tax=Acinetobacter baumannii TaxID=470 RepID=UPI001298419B|nr:hypothetical protein [Acinetobacter baumannii]EIB6744355.1 hypothetical protein [Acinetobacter baumannii]EKV6299047.1 hypothetical protein [Acinetobacter baumannii]EKW9137740.1 hypothetical protein [Acinetobacter baumannii]ELB1971046.1 hypothetical protein [Acinetobacter baumannii]MBC6334317.1 hypothetical protein [Acinetobacter baumannii]